MNNRNKISSNWTDFIKRMQQDIEKYKISDFYRAFKKHFKDETDFNNIIKKHPNSDKLIEIGSFYYWAKEEIKHPYIVFIAIISAMEAINTDRYFTFNEWLLSKGKDRAINFPINGDDNFKNEIDKLKDIYFEKHGAARKVKKFINEYFTEENKTKLINGLQIFDEKRNSYITKDLDTVVDILYQERSNFVHSAMFPQISPDKKGLIGYCKINRKEYFAKIKIFSGLLASMFEHAFIKYLKQDKTPN